MAGQIIGARFSDAEIQQIAAIATQLGIKKSDYIKSLALNAANRESAVLAESRASIESRGRRDIVGRQDTTK